MALQPSYRERSDGWESASPSQQPYFVEGDLIRCKMTSTIVTIVHISSDYYHVRLADGADYVDEWHDFEGYDGEPAKYELAAPVMI